MKKVAALTAGLLVLVLVGPAVVLAQSDPELTEPEEVTTQEQTTSSEDVTAESRAENREARIKEIKDRASERLTAAEEQRITRGCKGAQTVIDRLQSNIESVRERRSGVYSSISESLNILVAQLQAASVDTAELEAGIAQMQTLVDTVMASINSYSTTLSDLAAMDCEADPEGFKAVLDTARQQRRDIVAQAQVVKDYVTGDLKAILGVIRSELSANGTESTSEEG